MDIKEIKKEQYKLEDAILDLICKFNKKTNVTITDINLETIDITVIGSPTYLLHKVETVIEF